MKESPESVVRKVLRPGERIVWSGRPHVETAQRVAASRGRIRFLVGLAVSILLVLWLLRSGIVPNPFGELASLPLEPQFVVPIVVILLLMIVPKLLKFDSGSRLHRYFDSLTYAITDHRLLILEGDRISADYSAERVRQPRITERAPGYADVIFDQRTAEDADRRRTRDPVRLERAQVGFKALPNAPEIRQLIARWIEDRRRQASSEVSGFVESATESRRRQAPGDGPAGTRRIVNASLGFSLSIPEAWRAQVRQKKKPQGKFSRDAENWQEPGAAEDWNVVRIEGPGPCKIEAEVFETEPTVTFRKLAHSKLADSLSGKVIESSEDYAVNGIRGFFVTRRNEIQVDPTTGKAVFAAVVTPERHTVLHDGRRQVSIVSSWPEDSEALRAAVDAAVGSIELR